MLANIAAAVVGGGRRFAIATTAWEPDRHDVDDLLRARGAAAVAASNFSPGALVFGQLVEMAARQASRLPGYEPYIVEWHRHGKADRPSGTARDLARRILAADPSLRRVSSPTDGPAEPGALEGVAVRAGTNPGRHLVGFDGPGETIELTLTARDRSACASGGGSETCFMATEMTLSPPNGTSPVRMMRLRARSIFGSGMGAAESRAWV